MGGRQQRAQFLRRGPILSLLFILLFTLSFTNVLGARLGDRVVEKKLPNGLKVILMEDHKAPTATFQVWYRAGSRNEPWGKTGMSHLLEHMMFKGTKTVTGEAFGNMIAANGGDENAFTSRDFATYFENIASDRLTIPIRLEADRMKNLQLREKDFVTERMVVLEERRMRTEDDPQSFLMEQVNATVFQTSPYHWPVIGWEQDLQNLVLQDLKDYYATHYSPANAFIVVVGDFRKEEIFPLIAGAFGPIRKRPSPRQDKAIDPVQVGERRVEAKRVAELPYLVMAYHVPNIKSPDAFALEVLAAILGAGKSSRLYVNLIEQKQLALAVDADNSLLSRDPDAFSLFAQPLPGVDAGDLEKALDGEIAKIREEPVGEAELEKAKNQLEAAFVYGQQSLFYQAMLLAQFEIAAGDWRRIDDYVPAIRRITADDVKRVAARYLVSSNRTVGRLIPVEGPKKKTPPPAGSLPEKQMIK